MVANVQHHVAVGQSVCTCVLVDELVCMICVFVSVFIHTSTETISLLFHGLIVLSHSSSKNDTFILW